MSIGNLQRESVFQRDDDMLKKKTATSADNVKRLFIT